MGGCYLGDELAAHGSINIPIPGTAQDEVIVFDGLQFQSNVKITKVGIYTAEAPIGANLTIDLLKNSIEQNHISTLTDGSNYEITDVNDISYVTSERLGLKIKSIGSTKPGAGIIVTIHYEVL